MLYYFLKFKLPESPIKNFTSEAANIIINDSQSNLIIIIFNICSIPKVYLIFYITAFYNDQDRSEK